MDDRLFLTSWEAFPSLSHHSVRVFSAEPRFVSPHPGPKPKVFHLFLQAKVEMLDNLLDIEVAYSLLRGGSDDSSKDPIDVNYEKLKTDIKVTGPHLWCVCPFVLRAAIPRLEWVSPGDLLRTDCWADLQARVFGTRDSFLSGLPESSFFLNLEICLWRLV